MAKPLLGGSALRFVVSGGSVLSLIGLLHCGGASGTPLGGPGNGSDAGGGADASGPPHQGDSGGVPVPPGQCDAGGGTLPVGRPQAAACPATATIPGSTPASCATDADCVDAGGFGSFTCLHGKCGEDKCLTDADCATGTACACTSQIPGNARHGNECVTAHCHVDSDCGNVNGNGAMCSGAYGGGCSGLAGFYCRSAADTCRSSADCCGDTPQCAFQTTLGHWACQAAQICAG